MRALIVEHERATPGGYVSRWLADREAELTRRSDGPVRPLVHPAQVPVAAPSRKRR